ncbi:hypothetical protein jhhlp_000814 [Lomentospora prolificans]|uniref:DnaJ homologue subfamily C member 28 conserved domain-containing protein n=1 Tax=Lomentospora prolificans TaxID=41688 RepID=A0A2N3NJI2_9PEZI|nr:hypothetical protein jhhlp_000814 [Lomentospora prolificans]
MKLVPPTTFVCARCIWRNSITQPPTGRARFSGSPRAERPQNASDTDSPTSKPSYGKGHSSRESGGSLDKEKGALHRRLEQATEEALISGGRSGWRAIEDAGFSEELKARLYDKVAAAKSYSAEGLAGTQIAPGAGAGTRLHAEAKPWTGEESHEDAALRMLDDSKRKLPPDLRGRPVIPPPTLGVTGNKASGVKRAAGARELAQSYRTEGKGLTEGEREEFLRELRERFQPGARGLPNTISGLASLANERIEEAMARGQFKVSFLASVYILRMAAPGTSDSNSSKDIPRGPGIERDTRADNPFVDTTEYIMNKMIKRQALVPPWIDKQQELVKAVSNFRGRLRNDWKRHAARTIASRGGSLEDQVRAAEAYARAEAARNSTGQAAGSTGTGSVFRDRTWEATEMSYLKLAVENLNSLTRSYNLMAPELAKKPYFSLERELAACYADVAPLVAEEIRRRALAKPAPSLFGSFGGGGGGGAAGRECVRVYEKTGGEYGFKEMWRDLWGKDKS